MSTGSARENSINVAFLNSGKGNWLGGLYYLKNLLYAVSCLENKRLRPYIFIGKGAEPSVVDLIRPYAIVVRTGFVPRWQLPGMLSLHVNQWMLGWQLFHNHIQVISHPDISVDKLRRPVINWIPDFQHLHLPEMFSSEECRTRDMKFKKIITDSNIILLSSYDAFNDLKLFAPGYMAKARVVQFVSQVDHTLTRPGTESAQADALRISYGIEGKFFYFPSQFWKHKNHAILFEAVRIARETIKDILVVCSGAMHDYRHADHVGQLKQFIIKNGLSQNIKLLGLVEYLHVFFLMRHSLAILNPSLFEGWSSTVEEAKSLGKGMVLSDINVHREQSPSQTHYFDPNNPLELADILVSLWRVTEPGPDYRLEEQARRKLPERTRQFAKSYQDVVLELDVAS